MELRAQARAWNLTEGLGYRLFGETSADTLAGRTNRHHEGHGTRAMSQTRYDRNAKPDWDMGTVMIETRELRWSWQGQDIVSCSPARFFSFDGLGFSLVPWSPSLDRHRQYPNAVGVARLSGRQAVINLATRQLINSVSSQREYTFLAISSQSIMTSMPSMNMISCNSLARQRADDTRRRRPRCRIVVAEPPELCRLRHRAVH